MTLSIIVAAYNVEAYIEQCLTSIPEQQIRDKIQIIIINDESIDRTGEICRSIASNYPEMICIDQSHAGLGAARNTGLEAAETDYVTFLDGDDWYRNRFCSTVLERLEQLKDCDILFTLPIIYNMQSHTEYDWYDKETLESLNTRVSTYTNVKEEPILMGLQTSCCNRIYRTAFLKENGFHFPEGVHWEDVYPHFHLMHKADRVAFLTTTGFFYRQGRSEQITESKESRGEDLAVAFQMVMDEASCWPDQELRHVYSRLFDLTRWRCRDAKPIQRRTILQAISQMYDSFPEEQVRQYLTDKEITPSLGHRMMNCLIRRGSAFAVGIYRIRDVLCPV